MPQRDRTARPAACSARSAGADYWFSPKTVAGFALAGGGTSFRVADGGRGRSDLFQAGAFVRHAEGAAYFMAALAYGWQDVTTDRTVTIAGIDRLHATFNANSFARPRSKAATAMFVNRWIGLTPYAAGTGHVVRAAGLCRKRAVRGQHISR